MKAAIYNPYLDTLGGGERYTVSFAKVLADSGYEVKIEWEDDAIKEKLEDRFGINLKGIKFIESIKRGDNYDICFWVSDGSIPLLRARKNYLHFQFPFKGVKGKSLMNKMKLFRINEIICNSYFTKKFVDQEFDVDSKVIYPPVDISKFKKKKKENIILYVGRFSNLTQAKGQGVLVEVYKELVDSGIKGWKLVLAGGTEVGATDFLSKIKKEIKDYDIEIIESPHFDEILSLYGKASIFWSASGYKVNEKEEPTKVEHFGITLIEAMASGCIPIAYGAGGHKEIIANGENGFLWKTKEELREITEDIIDRKIVAKTIVNKAVKSSKVYEFKRFEAEVKNLIE